MSDCRHGGRDVYEAPGYLKNFDTEVGGGRVLHVPRRPRMTVTSIDMSAFVDKQHMASLRDIYAHGVRFARVRERDWDSEAMR